MPERPVELIYALDERPPWLQLLGLGFQHVAVICPYLVMVALVAEAAKLPREAAQSAVGLAMIAVAVMTVLQSLRVDRSVPGILSAGARSSCFSGCEPLMSSEGQDPVGADSPVDSNGRILHSSRISECIVRSAFFWGWRKTYALNLLMWGE